MSDKKTVDTGDQEVVDKAIDFWENNSKKIRINEKNIRFKLTSCFDFSFL